MFYYSMQSSPLGDISGLGQLEMCFNCTVQADKAIIPATGISYGYLGLGMDVTVFREIRKVEKRRIELLTPCF